MGLCGISDVKNAGPNLVALPEGAKSGNRTVEDLDRLAALLKEGYVTRDEFESLKAKILG